MTPSPKFRTSHSVDDALLAPWIATGTADSHDSRLFAAALASDVTLQDDLAAARAEHAAVVALGEALGRPSMRPLVALFAEIDAASPSLAPNVARLDLSRPRSAWRFDPHRAVDLKVKKIRSRR